ncbi:MAG: serine/threonine protein kinase, partial [Myxococcales bacterium]|nr:serine/threonine protein kinase [Myxococcales bacterium]
MLSPSSSSPQLGLVFDQRYRVLRKLEAGGMGTVYEAEQIRLGKRVAIKVLRREVTDNEVALRRFEREARLASRIRHRNVVELLDFGVEDKTAYYVMELLEGRNLASLLQEQGALPWQRARPILLQIARALQAAHRLGIIHRDVKPANCFLVDLEDDEEGELVKVLDFGIAKLDDTFDAQGQLTKTTELLGTVAYMSPEQAQSKTIDARSDVYSLGVLVYQVLAGRLPFEDDNAFNLLSKHVREPPPPPRSLVPAIPEAVEQAVLRALAKAPEDRFESM